MEPGPVQSIPRQAGRRDGEAQNQPCAWKAAGRPQSRLPISPRQRAPRLLPVGPAGDPDHQGPARPHGPATPPVVRRLVRRLPAGSEPVLPAGSQALRLGRYPAMPLELFLLTPTLQRLGKYLRRMGRAQRNPSGCSRNALKSQHPVGRQRGFTPTGCRRNRILAQSLQRRSKGRRSASLRPK
jgi:hypothetical protein